MIWSHANEANNKKENTEWLGTLCDTRDSSHIREEMTLHAHRYSRVPARSRTDSRDVAHARVQCSDSGAGIESTLTGEWKLTLDLYILVPGCTPTEGNLFQCLVTEKSRCLIRSHDCCGSVITRMHFNESLVTMWLLQVTGWSSRSTSLCPGRERPERAPTLEKWANMRSFYFFVLVCFKMNLTDISVDFYE